MNDEILRALLQEIIDDVDAGRIAILKPRAVTGLVGGSVLAVALGLGACSGGGTPAARDPGTARPAAVDATTAASRPAPPPPMDMGPQPEYAAPAPMGVDMGPQPEYGGPPVMRVDPGTYAEYGVPQMSD
jgi:hypothetical protein